MAKGKRNFISGRPGADNPGGVVFIRVPVEIDADTAKNFYEGGLATARDISAFLVDYANVNPIAVLKRAQHDLKGRAKEIQREKKKLQIQKKLKRLEAALAELEGDEE